MIYEFTDFLGETYSQIVDGRVASANASRVITGRDVVDGKSVLCTWDISGARTVLDTGDLVFGSTGVTMPVSQSGLMAAGVYAGLDWSTQSMGVSRASGEPELLPTSDPTANVFIFTINDAGVVGGEAAQHATRWVAGELEQSPPAAGAVRSSISQLNEAGDGYGGSFNDTGVFEAFIWKAAGAIEFLPMPDELTTSASVVISNLYFPVLFDDGGYVLVADAKDGDLDIGGSWIMGTGSYTKLPSPTETSQSRVRFGVSPTVLYGGVSGAGESTGPAAWINGTVYMLRDTIQIPNGANLNSIFAVLKEGTLVASTIPILGQSTPAFILLLHPA